jgi:uncharacterized Zn finger protein
MGEDPVPFSITEDVIRRHASFESFHSGEPYRGQGAVLSVIRRKNTIKAELAGSDYAPYKVHISFDESGILDAGCSCPYD